MIALDCKTNKPLFMDISLLPYLINYFIKTAANLTRWCSCAGNMNKGNTHDSSETPSINKTRRPVADFQHSQYSFP
jgi:hypothetical protein